MLANWRALADKEGPQADKARAHLADVPELTDYEERFYRSFWEISTERSFGMAPGPIPMRAIDYYAEREGMGPTDTMILNRVIRAMDNAYLAANAKRQEASAKRSGGKHPK